MVATLSSPVLWLTHCFQSEVSRQAEDHHSPLRPVRLAVGRKRRMWVSDMLSSALIIPGLRMVIATRCSVFAEQQTCLQNWEGSAEDWVEECNLKAD